jgi:hypothetical protein
MHERKKGNLRLEMESDNNVVKLRSLILEKELPKTNSNVFRTRFYYQTWLGIGFVFNKKKL